MGIICDFCYFDLKGQLKLPEMAFDQIQTCLIFPLRWASFPIQSGRNAQWEHLFSMYFDDLFTLCLIFDDKMISQWNTIYLQSLAMKELNAIRPEYNCFISIIISVDTLCGFPQSDNSIRWGCRWGNGINDLKPWHSGNTYPLRFLLISM